ncbi:MAG: hypothetical protein MN733_15890 [Nitrososphaera sp.]|nr:hypothetical protein [Nitrososphaera sp.]
MQKRLGFVLSIVGLAFIVMPLARVMQQPEFVMSVAGFGFFLLGIYLAIESVEKK